MSRQGLGLSVVPAYPGLGGSSPQKQQKKEDLSFALTMQQHCACPYSIPVPGQVMHIQGVCVYKGGSETWRNVGYGHHRGGKTRVGPGQTGQAQISPQAEAGAEQEEVFSFSHGSCLTYPARGYIPYPQTQGSALLPFLKAVLPTAF